MIVVRAKGETKFEHSLLKHSSFSKHSKLIYLTTRANKELGRGEFKVNLIRADRRAPDVDVRKQKTTVG